MKSLKLFLVFCAIYVLSIDVMAQHNRFKNERRIYLWDVTLSMKGYQDKTPNIYDKVIAALEKDINSIKDEQTEIWVLPFQTKILDKWNVKATNIGKKDLISRIRNFKNDDVTNTNITVPMKEVVKDIIKADKRNVLILLTDGNQNAKGYPLETLLDVIHKWCSFAEENDAYAFYVMLTQFAQNDKLIEAIDETCRMSKIISEEGNIDFNFVELLPQTNYKYNIKDDAGKKLSIQFDSKKFVNIPEDLQIHCYCGPNDYIEIEEVTSIVNGVLNISVKHKQSYDSLKENLPQDTNEKIMLYFEIENADKHQLVSLLNKECCLELINKPEKVLKVYVKD